ncbi:MAG: UDP-N-acetylmuramoyl-tripeptide--D-alanyl-D-alanine ligase [Clostridia bacterium]|nr:UDP-N-acetylmuramoyl-tripeptide--D-alanyl-D-alanine ligase [Clostridia bacterium]
MYLGLKQSGLTLGEAAGFMGGTLLGADPAARFFAFSTDSRKISGGELFFALSGERFDAHAFVPEVIAAGAACAVVSKPQAENIPHILVHDTKTALGAFAKNYYSLFSSFTIGVTGSVGKTTTKEFIAAVLAEKYETAKTAGNFNNEIGLPLTLLAFEAPKNALVAEMGMSARGEISRLTRIARPDIAVITNVGSSHLENLGTRENIALAKLEIAEGLPEDGVLIMNGDEPLLRAKKNIVKNTVFVSLIDKNCDYYAYNIEEGNNFLSFVYSSPDGKTHEGVKIPAVGKHNVYNALCAIVVGEKAGLSEEEIRAGLMAFTPPAMRAQVQKRGDFTVIEDCYNASPESMRASLAVLCGGAYGAGRKIAFLGEMRELGRDSAKMHFDVGAYAAHAGVQVLFTFGKNAEQIALGAKSAGMSEESIFTINDTENTDGAAEKLKEIIKKDDIILFKASRALKLERISAKI